MLSAESRWIDRSIVGSFLHRIRFVHSRLFRGRREKGIYQNILRIFFLSPPDFNDVERSYRARASLNESISFFLSRLKASIYWKEKAGFSNQLHSASFNTEPSGKLNLARSKPSNHALTLK